MPVSEVNALVAAKRVLVLAGNENVLKQISKGSWIGGTIPYFMNDSGGCIDKERVFVTDFTDVITEFKICDYNTANLPSLINDRRSGGFSWLVVPGFSQIHYKFALEVSSYPDLFDIPVMGWITGVDLSELGKNSPKTVNGLTGTFYENSAVAIHLSLPDNKYPNLEIINLFEQGSGDILTFNEDGFSAKECLVNGKSMNFANYIIQNNIDTRLPLVADYSGAMINISIQSVDQEKGIAFYAPVLKNIEYKIAKPVDNYIKAFNQVIPSETSKVIGSCNCILNYLYSELEGKKTGDLTGPITFGEIAYVLVNQTMVFMTIEDK